MNIYSSSGFLTVKAGPGLMLELLWSFCCCCRHQLVPQTKGCPTSVKLEESRGKGAATQRDHPGRMTRCWQSWPGLRFPDPQPRGFSTGHFSTGLLAPASAHHSFRNVSICVLKPRRAENTQNRGARLSPGKKRPAGCPRDARGPCSLSRAILL